MNNIKTLNVTGHKKLFYAVSIIIIVAAIIVSVVAGLNMAIEFKGGTLITYTYEGTIDTSAVENAVKDASGEDCSVSTGESMSGQTKTVTISFSTQNGLTADKQYQITDVLESEFAENKLAIYDSTDVSPTSGSEFFNKCLVAVVFSAIIMIVYIGFRFKKIGGWSAGFFAVVALIHDMLIVFACFVFFRFDINANFMAVLLTILGYSINATIIIYDRIRENERLYGHSVGLDELVNMSIAQTLRRTIHTNVTTIMAMVIVCIVAFVSNVTSIISFAFPLIVGLLAGAYSSNCIAPTLWVTWQNHKANKVVK